MAVVYAVILAGYILYITPVIVLGAVFIACSPIAAGVCIFVDDKWSDCMGNYFGHFVKATREIYGLPEVGGDYRDLEGHVPEACDPREGACGAYGDDNSKNETAMPNYCDPGMESCP
jgi:hypothetical protein